ncbi:hypothetical protein QL285_093464 [Trifolium repens]|nr:hypothetical protein QL285_093464 [Trifolium repens]
MVRGGYFFPRMPSSFCSTGAVRARVSPVCRVALTLLSRQVILLNFMGWIIGSSCYWAYAIRCWALVQSTAPQARGSKRRSGDDYGRDDRGDRGE